MQQIDFVITYSGKMTPMIVLRLMLKSLNRETSIDKKDTINLKISSVNKMKLCTEENLNIEKASLLCKTSDAVEQFRHFLGFLVDANLTPYLGSNCISKT